jgi:hypothetical protein|tara:strand:+ start:104 stop:316 length:213 start_codon:yes stop_codon:yes gene_type:complete
MYIDKQNQVLADPTASAWLKSALRALDSRDPVDALNDVEALQEIAEQRLNEAFSGFSFKNKWRIAGALDA